VQEIRDMMQGAAMAVLGHGGKHANDFGCLF
jgi:hypothetical protein